MIAYKYIVPLVMLISVPGCMIGPRQYTPCLPLPAAYTEKCVTSTLADLAQWWKLFEDPVLNDLITQALRCNYSLRNALEKIEETRAFYQLKVAQLFPQVDGVATVTRGKGSDFVLQNAVASRETLSYFSAGFDAFWEIDVWGKLRRAKNAAWYDYEAQIEQMHDVYVMLLADVARVYIDIRALDQKIILIDKQIELRSSNTALARERFAAGLASEIFVFQEQAFLDDLRSERIALTTVRVELCNQLAVLLGNPPHGCNVQPRNAAIPQVPLETAIGIPSDLLKRRPDIRRAKRILAATIERVGQAEADYFPSFSLLGSVTTQANHFRDIAQHGSLSWSVGPSMTWPLLTFGRISANIAVQKSRERQALLSYSQTVIEALGEVETALAATFNGQERVRVAMHKATAVQRELDDVAALFASGLVSQTDLLVVQVRLEQALRELLDVQRAQSIAAVALYKALGGGW